MVIQPPPAFFLKVKPLKGLQQVQACGFKGLQRVQNCKNNGPSLYRWTGEDLPDLADTRQPVILWMGHA